MDLPTSGAMGKASSLAHGLCLARPDKRVILIDGDGSLLMNLGTLVTVAGSMPHNLYHVVLDNEAYAVTGAQPPPGAGVVSFTGMARAAGYNAAFDFDDLEDLVTRIDEVLEHEAPILVSIKTVPVVDPRPLPQRGPWRRTPEAMRTMSEALHR
jgi:phosphonopyruvate decarboxylase